MEGVDQSDENHISRALIDWHVGRGTPLQVTCELPYVGNI